MKFTDLLLALFSGALTITSVYLARIAFLQKKSTQMAQRAYVKMSHSTPLEFDGTTGKGFVSITVTNDGLTPARIIDTKFKTLVQPDDVSMPKEPDYSGANKENLPQTFLSSKDHYTHHLKIITPVTEVGNVMQKKATLWIIGYVDYEDIFGNTHRSGYARFFNPDHLDASNLGFGNVPGYNYDCTL